ncbi:uncharacterized protein LOC122265550 [Penaeus japonicus]|uniref:uncharacterized protein LOC122265550 n=1 Tax=Penaeus japonicus TaxID=27405 RepID=UPI001C710FBB|nr:uncharacterized protein LOC122265550 [Penaeus japonicus]XP_042890855.1 uncharacterized protein LOC122265550 [Penaeus japonicus]
MASTEPATLEEEADLANIEVDLPAGKGESPDVDAWLKDFLGRLSKDVRDVLEVARTRRVAGLVLRRVMGTMACEGELCGEDEQDEQDDEDDEDEEARMVTRILDEEGVQRKVKTLLAAAEDEGRRAVTVTAAAEHEGRRAVAVTAAAKDEGRRAVTVTARAAEDLTTSIRDRLLRARAGVGGPADLEGHTAKEMTRLLGNTARNMREAMALSMSVDCMTRRAMAVVMKKFLAVMRTRMTLDLEKRVEMRVTVMLCDFVTDEGRRERLIEGLVATMRKEEEWRGRKEGRKEGEKLGRRDK